MIFFYNQQDLIFKKIFDKALVYFINELGNMDDGNYEEMFPHAVGYFNREAATQALIHIKKYQCKKDVYYVTIYHYVLIYDLIYMFADIQNDTALESGKPIVKVGKYKVWGIDYDSLVDLYGFDEWLLAPGKLRMMKDKDKYAVKLSNEKSYKPEEIGEMFDRKSMVYPDFEVVERGS